MTSDRERVFAGGLHVEWCDPACDGVSCDFITDILHTEAAIRKEVANKAATMVSSWEFYDP